eukprot:scpid87966/ scgid15479/ 
MSSCTVHNESMPLQDTQKAQCNRDIPESNHGGIVLNDRSFPHNNCNQITGIKSKFVTEDRKANGGEYSSIVPYQSSCYGGDCSCQHADIDAAHNPPYSNRSGGLVRARTAWRLCMATQRYLETILNTVLRDINGFPEYSRIH